MDPDTTANDLPIEPDAEPAGRCIPRDPEALLYPLEVAYLTALSVRTLESLRLRGGGPVFYALRRRAIRYKRSEVFEWIEATRRRSTSDPGPTSPSPVEA